MKDIIFIVLCNSKIITCRQDSQSLNFTPSTIWWRETINKQYPLYSTSRGFLEDEKNLAWDQSCKQESQLPIYD